MINVPLSISSALAASLVPSLVATVQTGNRKQVHNKINTVSRFNVLIAIPCAVGFITLAKPILNLLYFTQDNTTAARMLQMGALSVVFFCLSTVTNSVLQGLDDMMTPVKNAAISLVIHIVTLFLMLVVLKWNIYAVVLSKIIFSGAICILNAKALRDRIGYVQEKKKTFLIPTLASLIMGVIAIVIHLIFELFAGPYIATIIALLAAVAAYGVSIVALGGITEEELLGMPKEQPCDNMPETTFDKRGIQVSMRPVKKIALLHDICGVGKAAMMNMTPILSMMGIEVCPVPTVLLSTHTGGYALRRSAMYRRLYTCMCRSLQERTYYI